MKKNTNNTKEIIIVCILTLIVIGAIGFAIGLQSFTIIEWWKPAAACAIIAIPFTILLAKYMKHLTRPIIDYLEYPASFILSFAILLGAFYTLNFFLSDHSSSYEYHAPVVRKYSQVRTRSHKTGRRAYKEEKYTVYIVEVEMRDGKIKKMEKPLSEYNKIKKGKSLDLFIEEGLFSIPVIKPHHKAQSNTD